MHYLPVTEVRCTVSTMAHLATTVGDTTATRSMTVRDVADLYGVHISTVYRLIERGTLSAYRVGRSLRLDPDKVDAAFKAR